MEFNFNPAAEEKDPLKEYGRNLTDEAINNKLDPVIGRDDEIRRIIRILSRKTKNNPLLVGEPGVGKTAIVEGLAQKIVQGNVPENLKDKEVYEIDLPAMLAGASFQGQFEKRLKGLMKKIQDAQGQIIIFIDEIHMLIGTGKTSAQSGMDAAQIIKPMLARGEMRLIGATTLDEYRQYIEKDAALERRMQKVIVNEPDIKDTITILRGIKNRLENYHGVKIHDAALVAAATLSTRYIADRFLPDKAIDLVDEAAASIQTEINSMPEVLERANQEVARLEMEKAALAKEKDAKSLQRSEIIIEELKIVIKKRDTLQDQWLNEKNSLANVYQIKKTIEQLKTKQIRLESEARYDKASAILYKELPELEEKLAIALKHNPKDSGQLIKEDVDAEEIANIVAK
jgi:ATP-dependent Clp protease ATP-binding subunit ClpB